MDYNNSITILYIIITILVIVIIYLLYKTRNIEGFTVTDDVKAAINEVYMADIGAIRNLSSIAKEMTTNNDTLTIPAGNTLIAGKLTVNGDVEFVNKDTGFINHMPKFTVLSIATENVPKGWALCNGKTYKLNSTGVAYEVAASDTTGTLTPDLRGRFILGGGQGVDLTNRKINDKDGKEQFTLKIDNLPAHGHNMFSKDTAKLGVVTDPAYDTAGLIEAPSAPNVFISGSGDRGNSNSYTLFGRYKWPKDYFGRTSHFIINENGTPYWTNSPVSNMPPFYVLIYIMKL